jgi:hypothetical protein
MACLSMKYGAISSLDWVSAKVSPILFRLHTPQPCDTQSNHQTLSESIKPMRFLAQEREVDFLFFFILRTSGTTAPSQYTCT